MLRKHPEQKEPTSASTFLNMLSKLSPTKFLLYYLCASSLVKSQEASFDSTKRYLLALNPGTSKFLVVPPDTGVISVSHKCLLEMKQPSAHAVYSNTYELQYVCYSDNQDSNFVHPRAAIENGIYQGYGFLNGKLSYTLPSHSENNAFEKTTFDFSKENEITVQTQRLK